MITHPAIIRNIPLKSKQKLFHFIHVLLRQYKISSYFVSILLILQTLQMIYFIIHPVCCGIWQFNGFIIIQQILGYISCILIWVNGGIICIVACGIIMLVYGIGIGIILYQVKNCGIKDTYKITTIMDELQVKFMQYLAILSRTILVIPIISLQITTIRIYSNDLSPINILGILFAIISLLQYVCLTGLFLQLFIDNSPFSKYSLAGPITPIEKYKTYCKIFIAVLCSILPQSCSQTAYITYLVFAILYIICFIYLSYLYYVYPNLVYNNIRFVQQNSNMVLLFLYTMVAHIAQIQYGQQQYVYLVVLAGQNQKIEDRILYYTVITGILAYNYLFYQCIRDFQDNSLCLVKLLGILNDHVLNCNKIHQVCKCRIIKQKIKNFNYSKDAEHSAEQISLWFQFIKTKLIYNTQKMSHPTQFHLLLSYIQNKRLSNNFLSYFHLQKCSLKKQNIITQFLIQNQKIIIQKVLHDQDFRNNEKKQIDVNRFLQMTQLIDQFQQIVLKSSLEHLDFWTILSKRNKKNKSIITNQGNNLMATVKLCEEKYKIITEKYPQNLSALVLYSNYAKYILNNHELILKNKSLFNQIKKKLFRQIKISSQQQKQKYSQNAITGTIVISGQRNNVGIIKCCSSKITKLIKYAPYQLIGQNINLLMPSFIGNMHNEVLFKYLQLSYPQTNFVQRCVPMIDKNNFMILAKMMTKPIPSLINGMQLIGIFQRLRQQNVRHMNQSPKYLVYRCDIGNVQAISQNFFTNYGYRLMKVNQYSQISEQLNFGTLFNNVYDSDVKSSDQGIQCQLKLKKNDKKSRRVKIYLRLQILYFGTKVKLISIYNTFQGNYNAITIQNTINPDTQIAISQHSSDDQNQKSAQQINPNGGSPGKNTSQSLNQQELKQLKIKKPLKFVIFQIFLFLFICSIIAISMVQFYLNIKKVKVVNDLLQHISYVSNSMLYLVNIGYYTRMMHLSSLYPQYLPNFKSYQSNVSTLTDSLQKCQFWIVNKQVQIYSLLSFDLESEPLSWLINEKQQIKSKKQSLSLNIFDIVTSSSTFNSATPSDFNFRIKLIQDKIKANQNVYYRNLFTIRYSEIFQLIAAKQKYQQQLRATYLTNLSSYYQNNLIDIGVASGVILIFMIIMLKLLHLVLCSILSIKSVLNWLAPSQIQKQVQRCQNFMQLFFKNCYEVVLRLNKSQILRGYSFQQTHGHGKKGFFKLVKSPSYQVSDQNQQHQNYQQFLCENLGNNQQGQQIDMFESSQKKINKQKQKKSTIINTMGQVKNKDKQKQKQKQKQNKYSKIQNNQANNNNRSKINQSKLQKFNDEGTPLKNQQYQQIDIEENQVQNSLDLQNINLFLPVIMCCIFATVHYILMFFYIEAQHTNIINQVSAQNLLHLNMQSFERLNYYSLQFNLDPTPFVSYPNIQNLYINQTQRLYSLQQQLYQFSDQDKYSQQIQQKITKFNIDGVCSYFKQSVMYNKSSYNIDECIRIDRGILNSGMRSSIVAYIQSIKNISTNQPPQQLITKSSFTLIPILHKYIHSEILTLLQQSTSIIQSQISKQQTIIIIWSIILIVLIIIIGIMINITTSNILINKILGMYQIVSLIPKRVFERNNNLCEEYRKNVVKLLK